MTDTTYHRWRNEYGGPKLDQVKSQRTVHRKDRHDILEKGDLDVSFEEVVHPALAGRPAAAGEAGFRLPPAFTRIILPSDDRLTDFGHGVAERR
mgnify:FL=1